MIGYIKGVVKKKSNDHVLIVCNSGVGYEVFVSKYSLDNLALTKTVELMCHFIVREDANILFGFLDELERAMFRSIIKVNGVGPKLAMTILSYLPPQVLLTTVQEKSLVNLTSVPGIGKKSAERLLIELAGQFEKLNNTFPVSSTDSIGHEVKAEATNALIALGFKPPEITKAFSGLSLHNIDSQTLIKQALRVLSN